MGIDPDFSGDFPPFLNDRGINPVKRTQNREPEELVITRQPAALVSVAILLFAEDNSEKSSRRVSTYSARSAANRATRISRGRCKIRREWCRASVHAESRRGADLRIANAGVAWQAAWGSEHNTASGSEHSLLEESALEGVEDASTNSLVRCTTNMSCVTQSARNAWICAAKLISVLLICVLGGCGNSAGHRTKAMADVNPQSELAAAVLRGIDARSPAIERGQQVVMGTAPCVAGHQCYSCFQCHGLRGEGGAIAAQPRLAGQDRRYLALALNRFASGERKSATMSAVARALTEQQRRDVAIYYSVVDAPKSLAMVALADSDAQLGREIEQHGVSDRGVPPCVTCHARGVRVKGAAYPYLAGQYADYLDQQLERFRNGERRGADAQIMQMIARGLTSDQAQAVSAYLATQAPPPSSRLHSQ